MKNHLTNPSFEAVYAMDNLYTAWHKVSIGKSAKPSILEFYRNLDANLQTIADDLRNGIYLHQKTKKRYKARAAEIEHKRKQGIFSELDAGRRIESVTAHLLIARSLNFRNTVLHRRFFGV